MEPAEILVIHNPGSSRGRRVASRVREILRARRSIQAAWVPVTGLSKVGGGSYARVVVIGGDGTVNAAADWLVGCGLSLPLGIVPAGTGNNLAQGLGIPLETCRAAQLALEGRTRRSLDLLSYRAEGDGRERWIVQTAALGFPADVAGAYARLRRFPPFRPLFRPLGPYVYRVLALFGLAVQKVREWAGRAAISVRIELPSETLEEEVFAVFIGNERSLGGNFHPCPLAAVDDGRFDLCLIRAGTRDRYLDVFARVAQGRHLELEETVVYRQSEGPAVVSLSRELALLADGDLWVRSRRYELGLVPRRIEIVVPPPGGTEGSRPPGRAG